ncbi:hypothetical protein HYQ45_013045 [Verticillium longisporum]|uniref:Uncharacterized protein n=1 Tax=Verticillium longisporum TaxID=100787 RepID=A0A8I2ZBJ8_VERLO|nr:hypothetical protein HYQ45_013045 [Verticillium longisporum]
MASSSLPDPRTMPKKMPAIASKLGAFSLAQPASHKKTTAVQERMDETKRALRDLLRAEQDLAKKLGTTTDADKQAMQTRLEELETYDAEQAKLVSRLQVLRTNVSASEAACNRVMTKERLNGILDYTFTPETTLLIAGFQLVSVGGLEALFASNAEVERDLHSHKGSAATSSELVKELLRIAKHAPPLRRGMEQGLDSVNIISTSARRERELERRLDEEMKKNVDLQKARRDATAEARKHRLAVEAFKMSIKEVAPVLKRGLRADDDLAVRDRQIRQLRQELAQAQQRAENLDEELANSQKFQDEDPRDADDASKSDAGDDRRLQETEEVLRGMEIELDAERATVKARDATIAALESQATTMQRQLQLAFDARDSAERRAREERAEGQEIELHRSKAEDLQTQLANEARFTATNELAKLRQELSDMSRLKAIAEERRQLAQVLAEADKVFKQAADEKRAEVEQRLARLRLDHDKHSSELRASLQRQREDAVAQITAANDRTSQQVAALAKARADSEKELAAERSKAAEAADGLRAETDRQMERLAAAKAEAETRCIELEAEKINVQNSLSELLAATDGNDSEIADHKKRLEQAAEAGAQLGKQLVDVTARKANAESQVSAFEAENCELASQNRALRQASSTAEAMVGDVKKANAALETRVAAEWSDKVTAETRRADGELSERQRQEAAARRDLDNVRREEWGRNNELLDGFVTVFSAKSELWRRALMVLVYGDRIEADEPPRASFGQVTPWAPGSHELAMPSIGASNTSIVALQLLTQLTEESPEEAILEHAWVLWSLLRQGRDLETGIAGVIAEQLVTPRDRGQPLVLGIWLLLVEFARWPCLARYMQQFLDVLAPSETLLWVLNAARSGPDTVRGACRDVGAVLYLERTPERDEMALVSHPTWPMVLHVSFAGGWMRYVADVRFGLASLTLRASADGTASQKIELEWGDLVTPYLWWDNNVRKGD